MAAVPIQEGTGPRALLAKRSQSGWLGLIAPFREKDLRFELLSFGFRFCSPWCWLMLEVCVHVLRKMLASYGWLEGQSQGRGTLCRLCCS